MKRKRRTWKNSVDLDASLPECILRAHVLKAPHHGSEPANTQAFIDAGQTLETAVETAEGRKDEGIWILPATAANIGGLRPSSLLAHQQAHLIA